MIVGFQLQLVYKFSIVRVFEVFSLDRLTITAPLLGMNVKPLNLDIRDQYTPLDVVAFEYDARNV